MRWLKILVAAFAASVVALVTINMVTWGDPVPSWEDKLLYMNEQVHGPVDDETEDQLVDAAAWTCSTMLPDMTSNYGYTSNEDMISDAWWILVSSGLSADQAGTVLSAAVEYACPEFEYIFTGY